MTGARSSPADPLGLLADDGEYPGVAWCRRDARDLSSVSVTTADAVRRRIPQLTASSIRLAAVTFADVGLPADSLTQVRICPHGLPRAGSPSDGRQAALRLACSSRIAMLNSRS